MNVHIPCMDPMGCLSFRPPALGRFADRPGRRMTWEWVLQNACNSDVFFDITRAIDDRSEYGCVNITFVWCCLLLWLWWRKQCSVLTMHTVVSWCLMFTLICIYCEPWIVDHYQWHSALTCRSQLLLGIAALHRYVEPSQYIIHLDYD